MDNVDVIFHEGLIPAEVWTVVKKLIKNPLKASILALMIASFLSKNKPKKKESINNRLNIVEAQTTLNKFSKRKGKYFIKANYGQGFKIINLDDSAEPKTVIIELKRLIKIGAIIDAEIKKGGRTVISFNDLIKIDANTLARKL